MHKTFLDDLESFFTLSTSNKYITYIWELTLFGKITPVPLRWKILQKCDLQTGHKGEPIGAPDVCWKSLIVVTDSGIGKLVTRDVTSILTRKSFGPNVIDWRISSQNVTNLKQDEIFWEPTLHLWWLVSIQFSSASNYLKDEATKIISQWTFMSYISLSAFMEPTSENLMTIHTMVFTWLKVNLTQTYPIFLLYWFR